MKTIHNPTQISIPYFTTSKFSKEANIKITCDDMIDFLNIGIISKYIKYFKYFKYLYLKIFQIAKTLKNLAYWR